MALMPRSRVGGNCVVALRSCRRATWASIDGEQEIVVESDGAINYPHLVSARLAPSIIHHNFERNGLPLFQKIGVHDVVRVHENVGAAIIANDEPETSTRIIMRHFSNRHYSALVAFASRGLKVDQFRLGLLCDLFLLLSHRGFAQF